MNRIEAHVYNAFRAIPDSERKTRLTTEIIQDMQEMVSDFVAEGKSEEDAVNKAIVEFGDIDDLRAELIPTEEKRNRHGLNLAYSIIGSILIILLVVFINFYYSPHVIWCVYPIFAVLWWPLTMLFVWLRQR
jgi:uncharacterized membrane protein